jgi:hypothetical protein
MAIRVSITKLNTYFAGYIFETMPIIVAYCTIYLADMHSKILRINGNRKMGQ